MAASKVGIWREQSEEVSTARVSKAELDYSKEQTIRQGESAGGAA